MAISVIINSALLLALALHAALIGAAAGAPIWRALPADADNFHLRAFFALALGLALDIALVFGLGLFGLIRAPVLIAAGLAAAALASVLLRKRDFRWLLNLSAAELAVTAVFYVWVAATAIKVPGYADDTMYHLPLARFYAQTQGLGLDPWVRFPLFPQNMEMLFALALALRPGEALLAQGLAALPAFVIALGLIGAGRWLRGSWALAVGAAIIYVNLHVVENARLRLHRLWAGDVLLCDGPRRRALSGRSVARRLCCARRARGDGGRLQGPRNLLVAFVFVALVAFRTRLPALVAFALAAALFGCGWYVRSFWISGDPLSPAGGPWFGYFLWDAQDLAGQRGEIATHSVGTALWRFPQALIKGGANWLIPALLAPLAAPRNRQTIFALWALFMAYALFWFYVTQVDRYLAPVHAIGALLSALCMFDVIHRLAERFAPGALAWFRRPGATLVAVTALLAIFVNDAIATADKEVRGWDRILALRAGYPVVRKAAEVAPRYGDRLVAVGLATPQYFYDGVLMANWFGPGRYRQMFTDVPPRMRTAAEMREVLARFNSRLLALDLEFVIYDKADYDARFDTLFNDGKQVPVCGQEQRRRRRGGAGEIADWPGAPDRRNASRQDRAVSTGPLFVRWPRGGNHPGFAAPHRARSEIFGDLRSSPVVALRRLRSGSV